MMKIRVLEKLQNFPIGRYRCIAEYDNVVIITTGKYYGDEIEYFRLHLDDDKTATFNAVDYIMEVV